MLGKLPSWPDNLHYLADAGTFWLGLVLRPAKPMAMQLYRCKHLRAVAARVPESWVACIMWPFTGGGIQ